MTITASLSILAALAACAHHAEPGGPDASTAPDAALGPDAAAPSPLSCVTDVSAGHHLFPCDGGITYDVEIPAACAAGGCGLVVDLHGLTMNATEEDAGTAMRARGHQYGYVVVQPNAPGVPSSWDQATHAPLVFAFVADLAKAMLTDPRRAHATGFSQGGGMTWRLVCDHADFFASAAPLSALNGCPFSTAEAPSREVPILQVHGRDDGILNFDLFAVPQRDAALAYWKDDGGTVVEMDSGHDVTRYLSPSGTPLEFYAHDYAADSLVTRGHCFPGGTDIGPSPLQFGCANPDTFVVGERVMQFFLDHPMP
jgi:poly(3-hydroxybutyrate) depolymerase